MKNRECCHPAQNEVDILHSDLQVRGHRTCERTCHDWEKRISPFLASPFSPTRGQTVAQIFFSDGSTFSQDGWWDGALGAAPAVAAVGKLGPSTSTDLYREVNWADPSFKLTTSTMYNVHPGQVFVKISGNFHQNHNLKRQYQGI